MAKILIIEDEPDLASLLLFNLKADGHQAEAVSTGAAGLARTKATHPDLVLMDLMLPDISGSEVARMIKADSDLRHTGILMVTAKGSEADRVSGLELGADDYVVKPFSVRELLLRVRAVLRRKETLESDLKRLSIGGIVVDSERHEAHANGGVVNLTALEFRLLKTFLSRPGRVQTREVLLSDVWGIDADITTRTVDTHIKRLREKLGAAGEQIETIRGVGYRFSPANQE